MRRTRCRWRDWARATGAALVAASLLAATAAVAGEDANLAKVLGGFSTLPPGGSTPPSWRLQTFARVPRHTTYSLVVDDGTTVLRAHADAAAASLIRPLPPSLAENTESPWLRWRWKPLSAPARSTLGRKDADDWGARLYVLFEPPPTSLGFGERLGLAVARALHGDDLPARGLCYVWAPGGQPGAMAPNAFTDRLQMIVVDTGAPGSWHTIERNLAADYKAAFGQPMAPITAIAVSADSDNSGGIADVLFGDIVLDFTPAPTATSTVP